MNWPSLHAGHTVFAVLVHAEEMYIPALHDKQDEQAVLPVVVVNWPPGHDVQTVFA